MSKYLPDFTDIDKLSEFYKAVELAFDGVEDDHVLTIKQWQPNTAYKLNELVIFSNAFYQANSAFTSGATFVPANWTELPIGGGGAGDMLASTYDPQGIGQDIFQYADDSSGAVQVNLDNFIALMEKTMQIMQTPTGFADNNNIQVTYDSVTRTVTINAIVGTTIEAYKNGVLIPELVHGWTSPAHPDVADSYFLFHDGTSIQWTTTPWDWNDVMIAYVQYGTNNLCLNETHGLVMDPATHQEFHQTIGTYKLSGLGLTNYVLQSTTVADRRPDVEQGQVKDEDNITILPALTNNLYTIRNLTGASVRTLTTDQLEIVPVNGNQPYYNQNIGGVWQQTLMPSNTYQTLFLVAVPCSTDEESQKYRFMWVQGQDVFSTLAEALLQSPQGLEHGDLGDVVSEFVFTTKIVIGYGGNNWDIEAVEDITGTRQSFVNSPSGSYLSSVTTTGTQLSGDGTTNSPLEVVNTDTSAEVDAKIQAHNDLLTAHMEEKVKMTKSGKDANGIFTTLTYSRTDDTIFATSILSGGTSPEYTTRTETIYDVDGTTPLSTITYTRSYDSDGDLVSEV